MRQSQTPRRALALVASLGIVIASASSAHAQATLRWSHLGTSEVATDHDLAVGDGGGQVFTDTGRFGRRTRLFSAFAPDGQEIAWQTQSSAEVRERSIASDPWSDLYAVSLLEDSGSQRIVRLEVFDSSSPSPRWSYTFPGTFGGGEVNWCHITEDGQWILGAVKESSGVRIVRFPATTAPQSSPVAQTLIPWFGSLSTVLFDGHGQRVLLGSGAYCELRDVGSGAQLFSKYPSSGSTLGHALASGGRALAFASDDAVVIYSDGPSGFTHTRTLAPFAGLSSYWLREARLSQDGSVVVAAYIETSSWRTAHLFVWEVSTGAQLWSGSWTGAAGLQNIPSDLDLQGKSGERIAMSSRGDETGPAPELVVLESNASGGYDLVAEFNRPGSLMAVEFCPLGRRVAAAGRPGHLSDGGVSSVVELFELESDLRLEGLPRVGQLIEFEFEPEVPAQATPFCWLLDSAGPAEPPVSTAFGLLQVDRASALLRPMGATDGAGIARRSLTVQGPVGSRRYFQAFALTPRRLSTSWLQVTALP